MKIFHCDRCDHVVAFDARSCPRCGAAIGYVCDERDLRVIVPTSDPAVFRVDRDGAIDGVTLWRCPNSAWGCNWMLPTGSRDTSCRSCRLTRGRPDTGRPDEIEAWRRAEAAKRRLVHQLDVLALPIEAMSESMPDGLVFDLVHLPDRDGTTGHLDGVVTLDLAEKDELHRAHECRSSGDPVRTVIGHLRHEIGHFYWDRLVGQTDDLRGFRRLFGDERADDAEALERLHAPADGGWDRTLFVTAQASVHPLEDWAETFAHYLHILDAVDTAVAHALVPADRAGVLVAATVGSLDIDEILSAWRPVNAAVNAIVETHGSPAIDPFDPSEVLVDKLAFVHGQVAAHTARDRFYAGA